MNHINQTLYIPLYGKSYVSKKHILLHDPMAEEIWEKEGFQLKGKSKSKWLAYFMSMRSLVFDSWLKQAIINHPTATILHIGCGLDSRIKRINPTSFQWYDIDFKEVIEERKKYYQESPTYHMLSEDMRLDTWRQQIPKNKEVIVVMEGVSMYFTPKELEFLLFNLNQHFESVYLLMDCYSGKAAKISKYKNPIQDVGVKQVYGHSQTLAGYTFIKEHAICPQNYINELNGIEKIIFKHLFAGKFAQSLMTIYEYKN